MKKKWLILLICASAFGCKKKTPYPCTQIHIVSSGCGGTVVQFKDTNLGEDWINPANGEKLFNIALTEDIPQEYVNYEAPLYVTFEKTDKLTRDHCYVGGVPNYTVKIFSVDEKSCNQ